VLVTAKDVIAHEQGLDLLKDAKRARNDVEFDESNVLFTHQVDWMQQYLTPAAGGKGNVSSLQTEGKLDCPHCGSKNIGRWHTANATSASSEPSGKKSEGGAFIFTLKRKRVDTIAEGSTAKQRQIEDEQVSDDEEEEGGGGGKKKRATKRKKNVKASNLSNMGNFRNKNFNATATARSRKNQGNNVEEEDGSE